jgi:transcriptional regulator with XRE-family HTH domain
MSGAILLSEQIEELMQALGLSLAQLAQTLHTSNGTIYRWLADKCYPEGETRARLQALGALTIRLLQSFESPEAMRD